jgi:hypothetical protein
MSLLSNGRMEPVHMAGSAFLDPTGPEGPVAVLKATVTSLNDVALRRCDSKNLRGGVSIAIGIS